MTKAGGGFVTVSSLEDLPETAQLLGNLTVAWSHAERVMYFAFWLASGMTQPKAYDVYESISGFKLRQQITLSLLKHDQKAHPKYPELEAAYAELFQCGKVRNELTHRTWVKDDTGALALLDHRMSGGQTTAKAVDDDQLKTLIKTINRACDRFLAVTREIFPHAFVVGETE